MYAMRILEAMRNDLRFVLLGERTLCIPLDHHVCYDKCAECFYYDGDSYFVFYLTISMRSSRSMRSIIAIVAMNILGFPGVDDDTRSAHHFHTNSGSSSTINVHSHRMADTISAAAFQRKEEA